MATKKQVREIKRLMAELGDQLGELGDEAGDELTDEASELMDTLKSEIGRKWELARAKGREALAKAKLAGQQTDEYAHDNPWKVAASAALIGGLIGFLIASKKLRD